MATSVVIGLLVLSLLLRRNMIISAVGCEGTDKYVGTWKVTSVSGNGTPLPSALSYPLTISKKRGVKHTYWVSSWYLPAYPAGYAQVGDHLVAPGNNDTIYVDGDMLTMTLYRTDSGEPLTLVTTAVRQ